ncbi:hypothetical protein HZQ28_01100 [Elizabethkingia anophelis]|nr:hypothetical protein [Elizabethkingia anophelis]MCT3993084.1 hypothetical protein [Elizabethkingia anophelis]MCT3997141.1 hypothetical protein [Elizabethkingia anophelis]MCT4181812.1 hypothetical protein [Elizabethkingia anophelis]MCT4256603.1 hypothetical protein [Elizabethkingia anophelis]
MNDFEMNGRLLEASLILDCNVLDLISIHENVKKEGFTEYNRNKLRYNGFIVKETFEDTIRDFTGDSPIVAIGRVGTLSYLGDKANKQQYAYKCAKASLLKAAENAEAVKDFDLVYVAHDSIVNENNIILL